MTREDKIAKLKEELDKVATAPKGCVVSVHYFPDSYSIWKRKHNDDFEDYKISIERYLITTVGDKVTPDLQEELYRVLVNWLTEEV